ncbi:MAG: winged helix-turn-helix domain-containing protein [Desulfurococcaceae archaeon]
MSSKDLTETEKTIYLYLVDQGRPKGVRDISRDLNIPVSTVHYNLKKLEAKRLIVKTLEGYVAKKINPPWGFIVLGYKLIPRLLIYAAFFAGSTIASTILLIMEFSTERFLLLMISTTAFLLFLIEGLKTRGTLYRRKS